MPRAGAGAPARAPLHGHQQRREGAARYSATHERDALPSSAATVCAVAFDDVAATFAARRCFRFCATPSPASIRGAPDPTSSSRDDETIALCDAVFPIMSRITFSMIVRTRFLFPGVSSPCFDSLTSTCARRSVRSEGRE